MFYKEKFVSDTSYIFLFLVKFVLSPLYILYSLYLISIIKENLLSLFFCIYMYIRIRCYNILRAYCIQKLT